MASNQSFTTFEPSHLDVVLAVDFNYYGTRMATASADHRVKVYDRKEDSWNLVDTFGAHDAEITDVRPMTYGVTFDLAKKKLTSAR